MEKPNIYTHKIHWITHFRRIGILIIPSVLSILMFIAYILNGQIKYAVLTLIFALFIFVGQYLANAFVIKELNLDADEIKYKYLFASTTHLLDLKCVSHFCYYNRPVEKYNLMPYLEVYYKVENKTPNRNRLYICFSKQDRNLLLSRLHRFGFKVTVFETLREIQETENYIQEPERNNYA